MHSKGHHHGGETAGEATATPVEVGAQGAFCRHAFLHFQEVCVVRRLRGKGQEPLRIVVPHPGPLRVDLVMDLWAPSWTDAAPSVF